MEEEKIVNNQYNSEYYCEIECPCNLKIEIIGNEELWGRNKEQVKDSIETKIREELSDLEEHKECFMIRERMVIERERILNRRIDLLGIEFTVKIEYKGDKICWFKGRVLIPRN